MWSHTYYTQRPHTNISSISFYFLFKKTPRLETDASLREKSCFKRFQSGLLQKSVKLSEKLSKIGTLAVVISTRTIFITAHYGRWKMDHLRQEWTKNIVVKARWSPAKDKEARIDVKNSDAVCVAGLERNYSLRVALYLAKTVIK